NAVLAHGKDPVAEVIARRRLCPAAASAILGIHVALADREPVVNSEIGAAALEIGAGARARTVYGTGSERDDPVHIRAAADQVLILGEIDLLFAAEVVKASAIGQPHRLLAAHFEKLVCLRSVLANFSGKRGGP